MERLSSSDLNAGSCLFPRTLARNVPQEFDININTQANLNNEAAARLNYNAARSSRLTDRTVNMIHTGNGLNSQIGINNLTENTQMASSNSSSLRLNDSSRFNGQDLRVSGLLAGPSGRKPASREVNTSLQAERITNSIPANNRITNSVTSSRLLNSNRSDRPSNNMQGDIIPAEFQMQQLAISVNQIQQVFWDLRRDLTRVIDRVSALEVQMTAHDRLATLESQLAGSGSHLGVPDCFGMTAAASRILENDIFENYR